MDTLDNEPNERGRRARAARRTRVIESVRSGATEHGHDAPRPASVRRWLERDGEFRARYDSALATGTQVLAGDIIAAADREAASARGGRKTAAVKRQIAARKMVVKMMTDETPKTDENEEFKGLTDADIAFLQAACDRIYGRAPNADAPADEATDAADESDATSDDSDDPTTGDAGDGDQSADDTPEAEAEPEYDRYGNRIRRDPPGTWTVRFDTCVGEVSNRRVVDNTGMADFDPFSWTYGDDWRR